MAESKRRRRRVALLAGLARLADRVPLAAVRTTLALPARALRFGPVQGRILSNLELALGEELSPGDRRRLATAVRRHAARQLAEWAFLSNGNRSPRSKERVGAWIDRHVTFDPSIERLDEERRAGRGTIVVTAHLGNWEVLCAALRRRGFEGRVVGRHRERDPSADWLVQMRRAYGVETLAQDASPRELLRVLRSGGTLGLLTDLEERRLDGVFVPFFGIPALTMTAPIAIARAARLPLWPVRCTVEGKGYRLRVEDPLWIDASIGSEESDPGAPGVEDPRRARTLEMCTRLNACFEAWIRERPEQWAWHQHRWRTRPGEREILPHAAWRARMKAAKAP